MTLEQRKQIMAEAAEQRYVEFLGGETKYTGGTVHELTEKSGPIEREFYEFYRTQKENSHQKEQTPLTTTHPTLSSNVKFMNFYPFADIETISPRPMLFITGENAHSREFSEDAYRLAAEPKRTVYCARCRTRRPLRPCKPYTIQQTGIFLQGVSEEMKSCDNRKCKCDF